MPLELVTAICWPFLSCLPAVSHRARPMVREAIRAMPSISEAPLEQPAAAIVNCHGSESWGDCPEMCVMERMSEALVWTIKRTSLRDVVQSQLARADGS